MEGDNGRRSPCIKVVSYSLVIVSVSEYNDLPAITSPRLIVAVEVKPSIGPTAFESTDKALDRSGGKISDLEARRALNIKELREMVMLSDDSEIPTKDACVSIESGSWFVCFGARSMVYTIARSDER